VNKPWYRLNIDINNAVRTDFDFMQLRANSKFSTDPVAIWTYSKSQLTDIVNVEWLDYMKSIGLEPSSLLVFYRDPYYTASKAHVDIRRNNIPSIYAINWVIDPEDDSEMVWFKLPEDSGHSDITTANTYYKSWPMEELEELSRCCIKDIPTLVSIGIPHNIIVNDRPRWVISIRFPIEDHIQDWQSVNDVFNNFIIASA
jgi:hypothetical protein